MNTITKYLSLTTITPLRMDYIRLPSGTSADFKSRCIKYFSCINQFLEGVRSHPPNGGHSHPPNGGHSHLPVATDRQTEQERGIEVGACYIPFLQSCDSQSRVCKENVIWWLGSVSSTHFGKGGQNGACNK